MKGIKFRAWDILNKRYLNNDEFLWMDGGFIDPDTGHDLSGVCEFEQYTVLKDKNGKEIYEGDVVIPISDDNIYKKGVIEYDSESAAFVLKNERGNWQRFGITIFNDDMEVIGNIYENSELLENIA